MAHLVQGSMVGPYGHLGMVTKIAPADARGFQAILELTAAELAQVLRSETASQSRRAQTEWLIQYALERDLAIRPEWKSVS
jgi:hypothetical protein